MTKQIARQWQQFERSSIPKTAPPIQRQEMRRAFYAGAAALLHLAKGLGDDELTEDAGAAALEAMQQEIMEFFDRVAEGKA